MDCQELDALLEEHTLAELAPEQRQAVADHVADCERCRKKWGLDHRSQVLHDAAKPLSSDSSVKDAVMEKLKEPTPPGHRPATPKRLAGFELLGRVGKGGMGTVLKARQISMDRVVALKILPRRLAQSEQFVARFIREARSAAQLHHPNIVQAIDVGKSEGYYYFAMEFIDGEGLDAVLAREGPLEQNRALGVMKQVCSALAAAHKQGIIHRDIKPSNIMLDRDGQVRVTDFGLAKSTESDVAVTADGQTLGTPAYLAPEVARGRDAEPRSDLYSLGATFFHVLVGHPPFQGRNFSEVVVKQATEAPPLLGDAAPHVARPLCRVVDRLLAKAPDGRYPSAQALLDEFDALGHLKDHAEPDRPTVVARRPKHGATTARRLRRTRAAPASLLVAIAMAVLLAVGAAVFLVRRQGSPPPEPARLPGVGAQAAFEAAETYAAEQPDDLEGAVARFEAVRTEFPATEWAERAADRVQALERTREQRAAEARARQALEKALAEFEAQSSQLLAAGRFGAALERIEAFRKKHPTGSGAVGAEKLASNVLGKAQDRYSGLTRAVEAALAAKDYGKAREALKPALGFGIEGYEKRAKEKLAEIDEREAKAEHWAKWEAIKAESDRLARAGKWQEAAEALGPARKLPLANIAGLVVRQTQAVEAIRQNAVDAARAAHAARSDKMWELFRQREYAKATELIAELKADPALKLAADRVEGDAEAARLLDRFWAGVESNVAALVGKRLAIRSPVGTVKRVEDGTVTLEASGIEVKRHIHQMTAEQAVEMAQPGDDAQGRLLLATFLAAECEDLPKASEALAAAGESAAAEAVRRRLEHVTEAASATPTTPEEEKAGGWERLFDGQTLTGWRVIPGVNRRHVAVGQGVIGFYEHGCVGIVRDGAFPTDEYEVAAEIQPVRGGDQFCEMVFPVGDGYCAFVIGEGRLGLDRVEGAAWRGNRTTVRRQFTRREWHTVRVRVEAKRIVVRVDRDQVIELPRAGVRLTLWPGFENYRPFGIASRGTRTAIRRILVRRLGGDEAPVVGVGVTARDGWQKTGLSVAAGRRYELAATGTWSAVGGQRCGPKGAGTTAKADFALPSAPVAALVGRVGKPGRPFLVGSRLALAPQESGLLYLAMNDNRYQDNSGELCVTIRELSAQAGWTDLFDGGSLREWTPRSGDWSVADGAIAGRIGTRDGILEYTAASFRDFVLEAEVLSTGKVPGARLGMLFRKQGGRFLSFTVNDQFDGAGIVAGGVWSGKMKGVVLRWQPGLTVTRDPKKAFEGVSLPIASGRWYRLSVRCEAQRFQCLLDDRMLAEGEAAAPVSGTVGLCIHRADARFRNIRLRRLAPTVEPGPWRSLFDGTSTKDWKPIPKEGSFAGAGPVSLKDGAIVMGPGHPHTGVLWAGPLPKGSYELAYEAAKLAGPYQFGCVAFPVGDSLCMLDMGGGARHNIVGLSGVDGKSFTGNLTTQRIGFRHNQWYRLRVRVSDEKVEIWLDERQIVDLPRAGHTFRASLPGGARSFAFFGYKNTCAVRDVRVRSLGSARDQAAATVPQ